MWIKVPSFFFAGTTPPLIRKPLMFVKAIMLLVRQMKWIQGGILMQQIIYKTPSKLSEVTLVDGTLSLNYFYRFIL